MNEMAHNQRQAIKVFKIIKERNYVVRAISKKKNARSHIFSGWGEKVESNAGL